MSFLQFYNLREWNFVTRNFIQLMDNMSPKDQDTFNFDVLKIDWETYMENYVCGIRMNMFKDDLSILPDARNTLKKSEPHRKINVTHYSEWGSHLAAG